MSQRGKPRLSERHPEGDFQAPMPKKAGRTWLATRLCCRCMQHYSHPLQPGWRVNATEDGSQLWVCPACALPDDPDPDGRTETDG